MKRRLWNTTNFDSETMWTNVIHSVQLSTACHNNPLHLYMLLPLENPFAPQIQYTSRYCVTEKLTFAVNSVSKRRSKPTPWQLAAACKALSESRSLVFTCFYSMCSYHHCHCTRTQETLTSWINLCTTIFFQIPRITTIPDPCHTLIFAGNSLGLVPAGLSNACTAGINAHSTPQKYCELLPLLREAWQGCGKVCIRNFWTGGNSL